MADNDKIISMVEDFLDLADTPKDMFIRNMEHAHYLYNNDLERWIPGTEDPIEVNDGHPPSTENMIQSMLLDAVSLLLKNYPMFRVKPFKPSDFDLSDEMNKHVLSAWEQADTQRLLQLSQLNALIAGLSVLEIRPEKDVTGAVKFIIELVPHEDIWFNPKEIVYDKCWVVRRTWHTRRDLELNWGEEEVEDALGYAPSMQWQIDESEEHVPTWWDEVDELYPLYSIWVTPNEYDPDIQEEEEILGAPYGRKYEILNRKVLRDVANPYAMPFMSETTEQELWIGHKTHPFIVHECNRNIDSSGYCGFYDVSGIVNAMESSQWELNELTRILMQLGRRVAQPPIVAPEGSLTEPTSNITYTAGKVIQYDPQVSPQPPTPVPMPADASFIQYLHGQRKGALREISGIRDFMTGGGQQPGTSHTPTGTIASVQEASFTRMWTIVSALDRAIQQIGYRMLGIMQQFYELGTYNSVSVNGDQWYGEWQSKHIENEFKVEVVSGMSTPLRDMDRVQTATQIFQAVSPIIQMGPVPQNVPMLRLIKAYLNTINEPAAWEYLNLVNTMLEQAEQAEQAAMMQQQRPMMAAPQQPFAPVQQQIYSEGR